MDAITGHRLEIQITDAWRLDEAPPATFDQAAPNARSFALLNAGSSMAAMIAMMVMTTSNSISVNPSSSRNGLIVSLSLVFMVVF